MKHTILMLLTAMVLMLGGCTSRSAEEQLMVIALGVDLPSAESVKLTVRVPSFSGTSSEGGGSSSDGYLTLTAQSDSFPSALALLHATAPRTLNFSQTREILLGEDTLPCIPQWLDMIDRMDGMRSQSAVALCKGQAEDVINAQKAAVGTRLSRYIDTTLESGIRDGSIPDATLIRVMTQLSGGYQDAMLAYIGQSANPASKEKEPQNTQASAQALDALGGGMPQISGKEVEWMGSAVMDGPHVSGLLTGFETALCRFLGRDIQEIPYMTQDALVSLSPRLGPYLSIEKRGNTTLCLQAHLNVLPKLGAAIDLNKLQSELEETIRNLLINLQSLRSDVLGYGGIAVRRFSTLDDWIASNWKSIYANANVQVQLKLTLIDE